MISLKNQPELVEAYRYHDTWMTNVFPYYERWFCLNSIPDSGVRKVTVAESLKELGTYISDTETDFEIRQCLCVLPNGHSGKCRMNYDCNSKPLQKKLDYVKITEGEAIGPLKNRASRIFPICFSKSTASQLKHSVSKVGIPISNSSTPEGISTCLIDIYTYIQKIRGKFKNIAFKHHWEYLKTKFPHISKDDTLVCPVTGNPITLDMLSLNAREHQDGIEMGHLNCRNEKRFTIRGMNVFLMTRLGNRLIGEERFDSQEFRDNMLRISKHGS
jgi:hypothetical protein